MLEMFIPDAIIAGVDLLSNAVAGYVVPDQTKKKVAYSHQPSNNDTWNSNNDIWNSYIKEYNDFKNSLNITENEKDQLNAITVKMINFASKHRFTVIINGTK